MEIKLSRNELAKGVNTVNKAVPSKTTMSVLESILLEITDTIKLLANDTEIAIETTVDGTIVEPGTVAIDAKMLTELVKKLPDNDVTINAEGDMAHIKCGKLAVDAPCHSGEDFPQIPAVSKEENLVIAQFSLKEIIRQTVFSVSDNDANKMMTGECIEVTGNKLKVVSLDGHRVSLRSIELKNSYGDKKVIVPAKTLNEIMKIMNGDVDTETQIFITTNHILFEFDNTVVVSRLIAGDYFSLDQMLGMDYKTKVKVNRKEFMESIDRSTLLANNQDKKPVILAITDGMLQWSIKSHKGSMSEDIGIEKSGEDITVAFNPYFLLDALKVIDDDNVTIYLSGQKMPCQIKDDEGRYVYLILPVNFNC